MADGERYSTLFQLKQYPPEATPAVILSYLEPLRSMRVERIDVSDLNTKITNPPRGHRPGGSTPAPPMDQSKGAAKGDATASGEISIGSSGLDHWLEHTKHLAEVTPPTRRSAQD